MKIVRATVYFVRGEGWVDNVPVVETELEGLPVYSLEGYQLDKVISPEPTFVAHPND